MSESPAKNLPLPTQNIAVVVIDVQVGPFTTKPPPFEAEEVVQRINLVTNKARAAQVPVIFIRHEGPPDPNWLVRAGWEFHPALQLDPNETVIRKSTADAFHGTDLERVLRSAGVQRLLLMGYATDFCVDATLRNAASKDFEIVVVADAHTTNDTPELKAGAIRNHFNRIWPDGYSSRPIHLLTSAQVRFGSL
jgi:nicotinamidase-related amidase